VHGKALISINKSIKGVKFLLTYMLENIELLREEDYWKGPIGKPKLRINVSIL